MRMDARKKILFIITKSVWGGAQRYVYDLAMHLPRDRFDVAVAAGGDGRLFDLLKEVGVRTIPIPALGRNIHIYHEWRSFWEIVKVIRRERPDVVHLNSTKAGALGAIAAFILKFLQPATYNLQPNIIFTAHGWGFHEDRRRLARAAIFFVSWLSSLWQDTIIVLDAADRATAETFIPRRKLAWIPNGIGGIDFNARPDSSGRAAARAFLAQKIGRSIHPDTILIGTIAELTKNKGLSYLIAALPVSSLSLDYRGLGSIVTVVIGEGEERTRLERQIADADLGTRVFLAGFIPDAARYLKGLDIFVLPSLKEGLPYAVMEAMAAGLPVVATRVGGVPDLITDGENGLLAPPKDPQAIAAALIRLAGSPETRAQIGLRARETIETNFPFDAMLRRTRALYDHAAPSH